MTGAVRAIDRVLTHRGINFGEYDPARLGEFAKCLFNLQDHDVLSDIPEAEGLEVLRLALEEEVPRGPVPSEQGRRSIMSNAAPALLGWVHVIDKAVEKETAKRLRWVDLVLQCSTAARVFALSLIEVGMPLPQLATIGIGGSAPNSVPLVLLDFSWPGRSFRLYVGLDGVTLDAPPLSALLTRSDESARQIRAHYDRLRGT